MAREIDDMVANGAAWRHDLEQPGRPIAPAVGEATLNALGQAIVRSGSALAPICRVVTTSYVAHAIGIIEAFGPPGQGTAAVASQLAQKWRVATAAERAAVVSDYLHGQPGSSEQVSSVSVRTVSSSAGAATIEVTSEVTSYVAGSGPSGSQRFQERGSQRLEVFAHRLGGRWFATSLGGFALGNGSSSSTSSTEPPSQPTTLGTAPSSAGPPSSQPTPDLFVSTAATPFPGWIYRWPNYPVAIRMDSDDQIGGISPAAPISWTAGPGDASAAGVWWSTLCSGTPGNNCSHSAGGVRLYATAPRTCMVRFANRSTGATESQELDVFTDFSFQFTSGPSAGQTHSFPQPCS